MASKTEMFIKRPIVIIAIIILLLVFVHWYFYERKKKQAAAGGASTSVDPNTSLSPSNNGAMAGVANTPIAPVSTSLAPIAPATRGTPTPSTGGGVVLPGGVTINKIPDSTQLIDNFFIPPTQQIIPNNLLTSVNPGRTSVSTNKSIIPNNLLTALR